MAAPKTPHKPKTATETILSRRCAVDGVPLAEGWCSVGLGYALAADVTYRDDTGTLRKTSVVCRCPWVCQVCRQPLEWSGGCLTCDSHAPGATIQGDRYELEVDDQERSMGHYQLTQRGPLRLATRAEAEAGFAELRRLVKGIGRPVPPAPVPDPDEPAWVTEPSR